MVALPTADSRAQRAVRDFDRYDFRAVEIKTSRGPVTAVYVTAPAKKDGFRTVYTVALHPAENSARCCCGDAIHRGVRCKHAWMALAFLNVKEPRELAPQPAAVPVVDETPEERAARRARVLKDRELWD
ncbi:MAG: hypothetical protein ACK47B_09195 [Armatimonadota bacterium]